MLLRAHPDPIPTIPHHPRHLMKHKTNTQFIYHAFYRAPSASMQCAYIGLHNPITRGSFQWEDGSPVVWTHWDSNQPVYDPTLQETGVTVHLHDDFKFRVTGGKIKEHAICVYPG